MNRPQRGEGGAIAIVVAVFSLTLFGFAAIVVDLGVARATRTEAQTAADAATLAGAGALYKEPSLVPREDDAVEAIKHIAFENYLSQSYDSEADADAAWAACPAPPATDPKSSWAMAATSNSQCIRVGPGTPPSQVWVRMPVRRAGAFFGGVLGYSGIDVTATSTAEARESSVQACSLCIADFLDLDGSVRVEGDGSVTADDAKVEDNGRIVVVGRGSIGFARNPDPRRGPRYSEEPVVPLAPRDPFLGVAMPGSLPNNNLNDSTCGGGTLATNQAFDDLTVTGACTLPSDGMLVVTGTLLVTSGASLNGSSASVFLTCRNSQGSNGKAELCASGGRDGGSLQVEEGGSANLAGSSSRTGVNRFALLSDSNNTSTMEVEGLVNVTNASVYARKAEVSVSGAAADVRVIDGLVSVEELTLEDDAGIYVSRIGLSSQPGPPRVALLE